MIGTIGSPCFCENRTMTLPLQPDPLPLTLDAQGVVRVTNSRVTLDLLIDAFQSGSAPEEIAEQIPNLDLGDLYPIFGWYMHHRSDVDAYYEAGQQQAATIQQEIEARYPPPELKARLLARQRL